LKIDESMRTTNFIYRKVVILHRLDFGHSWFRTSGVFKASKQLGFVHLERCIHKTMADKTGAKQPLAVLKIT